ncbi:MAG: hypothetical protein ACFFG0_01765 [Candidatus Thorarchaeota archaeon]
MMYDPIARNSTATYFEYDFEKEMKKIIPHHKIDGSCKDYIVKVMCSLFCNDLVEYFTRSSHVEQKQMLNYLYEEGMQKEDAETLKRI